MHADQDPLGAYLRRLQTATGDLPPDVREDLLADVQGHLEEIRRRAGSEADLRAAVERLGPPEAIAAEARGGPASAAGAWSPPPVGVASSSTARDVTTVLVVLFGPLLLMLPFGILGVVSGWVLGLALLWSSRSWTAAEKALGTLVWPGGLATPILLGLMGTRVCTTMESSDGVFATECTGFALPTWLGVPVVLVVFAAPLAVAIALLRRADARRAAVRHRAPAPPGVGTP